MSTPFYSALRAHQELGRSSFHTPGHKSNPAAIPPDLLSLDYTELPDTDSLYEADGAILAAEQQAAERFGVDRTLFSAGGCTLCIQTMLHLAARPGQKVIFGRVLHRSAVHAMALLDLNPVWVLPRPDAGPGLAGRIHAHDIAQALVKHPDAAAVYLTAPDYYGVLPDIQAIAAVCREHNVPLLVDNAHGTHLRFLSRDLHPATLGASMTACSAHKTLPVLTGGAFLNIADPRFSPHAKEAMSLFGSTSPSYPIMASLDLCGKWLDQQARDQFITLENTVSRMKIFAMAQGISVPLGLCDPIRLTLNTHTAGVPGEKAAEHFRALGVEPEYSDDAHVVFLPSPFNQEQDFSRLAEGIQTLAFSTSESQVPVSGALPNLPEQVITPRQALFAAQEEIPVEHSAGRIAAQASCPCPPGVPVVMPGEKITCEISEFLRRYGFFSIKVIK